jgi:sigma-B regulation protein RsbU (phosphoserine phosphatase)
MTLINSTMHRAESERELTCSGIWGGIRAIDRQVNAGGVLASVYSSSCDGGRGGDIYYVAVCRGDQFTAVAIADVVGHGRAVSAVSQYMYDALRGHMCRLDSTAILAEMNRLAVRKGLKAMTTAAAVVYDAAAGVFRVAYAGHPPFLIKRGDEKTWSVALSDDDDESAGEDLPLAVDPDTVYNEQVIGVTPGDRLFIYTDGVVEAPNGQDELFGVDRLGDVLNAHADAPLPQMKSAVLGALAEHTGDDLTHDDLTLIALEVR